MSRNDTLSISLSITPTWSIIRDIQARTELFMTGHGASRDLAEATVMCASELLENAIKYGSSDSDSNRISFSLGIAGGNVLISVSNGIRDEADARYVKSHIERIRNSGNPGELYTERLMQMMENPKPGVSQLGLYRIAYEGEFTLDVTLHDGILIVRAGRPFEGRS